MSNSSVELYATMEYIKYILVQASIPYIVVISLVGIVGNVITIVMLSKRSLTKNFNNCTLIALASTDLLFNLALVSRCLMDFTGFESIRICRVLSFISHLAELLSACFTAHFTVQRFIAVRFPLSTFLEKRNHFIHYIIVLLFVLFGISYCAMLIIRNVYDGCQEELYLDWFISDALSSFVIPFTMIAILNLLIIFHLRKTCQRNEDLFVKRRSRKNILPLTLRKKSFTPYETTSQTKLSDDTIVPAFKTSKTQLTTNDDLKEQFLTVDRNPVHRSGSIRSTTRSHAQSYRVTRMLILVSTCFLLLNAPSHICSITLKIYTIKKSQMIENYFKSLQNNSDTAALMANATAVARLTALDPDNRLTINVNFYRIFYIVVIIAQHISYLSYSINFFLYSFCGMKFRRELIKYLARYGKCQGRGQPTPSRTITN